MKTEKDLLKHFKKLRSDLNDFYDYALKQIALAFLETVIPLTPVTQNHDYEINGKRYQARGGALRRGWIGEKDLDDDKEYPAPTSQEMMEYINELPVSRRSITLANTVEYALFVNYGHKQTPGRYVPELGKRLVNYWVDGVPFKEEAENAIRPQLGRIVGEAWKDWIKEWNKKS